MTGKLVNVCGGIVPLVLFLLLGSSLSCGQNTSKEISGKSSGKGTSDIRYCSTTHFLEESEERDIEASVMAFGAREIEDFEVKSFLLVDQSGRRQRFVGTGAGFGKGGRYIHFSGKVTSKDACVVYLKVQFVFNGDVLELRSKYRKWTEEEKALQYEGDKSTWKYVASEVKVIGTR